MSSSSSSTMTLEVPLSFLEGKVCLAEVSKASSSESSTEEVFVTTEEDLAVLAFLVDFFTGCDDEERSDRGAKRRVGIKLQQ